MKFKKGDRVIYVPPKRDIGHHLDFQIATVVKNKATNVFDKKDRVSVVYDCYPNEILHPVREFLVPLEIWNSPLAKAMRENDECSSNDEVLTHCVTDIKNNTI